MENKENKLKPLGLLPSFSIFGAASVLLLIQTNFTIPYLSQKTGIETIFFWFLVAGVGVFLPLIITAIFILRSEGYDLSINTITKRLRFVKLTKSALLWSLGGIVVISILSGTIMIGLELAFGKAEHSPPFMSFDPLTPDRYWLLAVWLPYWVLNILGEEILWRGVMLPRQELSFRKNTWLVHALGWGIFHLAFGWQLLLTLLPILFVQSYVVQKTKNSWTGVIIHAIINGPSFLAIAFGLL